MQAPQQMRVRFPPHLAVRRHPAHVHRKCTLHQRQLQHQRGRPRRRAEEVVVKTCALTAFIAGGRGFEPPAPSFARLNRSAVPASPTARWPPPTDLGSLGLRAETYACACL